MTSHLDAREASGDRSGTEEQRHTDFDDGEETAGGRVARFENGRRIDYRDGNGLMITDLDAREALGDGRRVLSLSMPMMARTTLTSVQSLGHSYR
jgi:hypothetical protein